MTGRVRGKGEVMPYQAIIFAGIAGGAVFLAGAAAMFFIFRIPDALSELTGRKARREIRAILAREQAAEAVGSAGEIKAEDGETMLLQGVEEGETELLHAQGVTGD